MNKESYSHRLNYLLDAFGGFTARCGLTKDEEIDFLEKLLKLKRDTYATEERKDK